MIEAASDSGIGSDEISDFDGWTQLPRDVMLTVDSSGSMRQNKTGKKRKQKKKKSKCLRITTFNLVKECGDTRNVYDDCNNCKKDNVKNNARTLTTSNVKTATGKLSNLLSEFCRRCSLLSITSSSMEAPFNEKSGYEKEDENKTSKHHQWTSAVGEEEIFHNMQFFDTIAPTKRLSLRSTKRKSLTDIAKYAALISAVIVIVVVKLCPDMTRPILSSQKPYLRAIKNFNVRSASRSKHVDKSNLHTSIEPFIAKSGKDISLTSKFRWRRDLELLDFTLETKAKYLHNRPLHANVLLTESPRSSVSDLSVSNSFQQQVMNAQATSSGSSVVDPSLIDYEAIDVYWRRDIEQEKNPYYAAPQPLHSSLMSNALSAEFDQYERDLQLLTEKSLTVQLDCEERSQYENLSKNYYTDFYLNVDKEADDKENQDSLEFWPSSSRSSGCSPTNACLSSSFNYLLPSTSKGGLTLLEANLDNLDSNPCNFWPQSSTSSPIVNEKAAAERTPSLNRGPDVNGGDILLNDVSLTDATTELLTGDVSEFFNFNNPTNLTAEDISMLGGENSDSENDDASLSVPFENIFDEGFFDANLGVDGLTLDELATEVMREHPFQDLPTVESVHTRLGPPVMDEVDRIRYESTGTPSSGINSATVASSPSHISSHEEFSSHSADGMDSRFYNKLAPRTAPIHFGALFNSDAYFDDHDYYAQSSSASFQRVDSGEADDTRKDVTLRRGRRSKDEELALEYNLPATAEEITRMTHAQVQHILRDPQFSAMQKALVKKIRRRGRNKVAARKCRERRTNPSLFEDKPQVRSRQYSELSVSTPSTSRQAAMYSPIMRIPSERTTAAYESTVDYFSDNMDEDYMPSYTADFMHEQDEFFARYRHDRVKFDSTKKHEYNTDNRRFFS